MLAFRNEETLQLALKGYYTHHQSILKYKASLFKGNQSHQPVQRTPNHQGNIYYPCWEVIPPKSNNFHGIKYTTQLLRCKPNLQQSFYKLTVICGMKHRLYQSIVKINLCYLRYLSNTTWADYKSLTSGNHPTQNIFIAILNSWNVLLHLLLLWENETSTL